MKKNIRNLIVAAALGGLSALSAFAATVSVTITSQTLTTPGASLYLNKNESLTYALTGTATGFILLEKSFNASNFAPTGISVTGSGPVSATGKLYSGSQSTYYRWRASTMTAGATGTGSFVTSLYDNDDVVQEFKNNKGIPIVIISDDSTAISGTLTASSGTITNLNATGGIISGVTVTNPNLNGVFLTSATLSGPLTLTTASTITYTATRLEGTATDYSTTTHNGGHTFSGINTFSGTDAVSGTKTNTATVINGTKTDNSTTTYSGSNTFSNSQTFKFNDTDPVTNGTGQIILQNTATGATANAVISFNTDQGAGANRRARIIVDKAGTNGGEMTLAVRDDAGSLFNTGLIIKSTDGAAIITGTTTNDDAPSGKYGETISTVTTSSSAFASSGTWGDLVSRSYTAGDWLCSGVIYSADNGATVTSINLGISQTSGNSVTGLTKGDNWVTGTLPTATTDGSASIPNFRVSLSGAATLYLKYMSTYSAGPPNAAGRLRCVRIR